MSITTVPLPDTSVEVPSWLRRHLTWLLVGFAVLATALLATVVVLDDASTEVTPATGASTFDADRGSISAIDHRAATVAPSSGALRESITAIDHRTAAAVSSSGVLTESITALDHQAESR